MPWKAHLFIADCLRGEEPMAVLCERYGISPSPSRFTIPLAMNPAIRPRMTQAI
jgi:hypothetical protein